MDTNDLQAGTSSREIADRLHRVDPQPRSSSLIVVGVSLAIIGAVVAVASSSDHLVPLAVGLALFVAGAAIGLAFVPSLRADLAVTGQESGSTSKRKADGALARWTFRDSIALVQFGPDPEQVTGRQTGART